MATHRRNGETLRDLLNGWAEREHMSDGALIMQLGISLSTLANWRTGASAPPPNKWPLIADRTGRTMEDIALSIARGVKSLSASVNDATATTGKV